MTKEEKRYPIQFDSKGYSEKPKGKEIGGIKIRTQSSEPKLLTLREIANLIQTGHSFSPGILEGGCSAIHWTQQQLFPVDIDNEDVNSPILTIKKALDICKECRISPVIYYKSFSHTEEKPKFRLIFAMRKPVEMEERREFLADTFPTLFPQSDTSCVNADRIYFGTNKEVNIYDN